MKEKNVKTKKTWSVKRILLTFLLIGIILAVAFCAWLFVVQISNFNPAHEHLPTWSSCTYCEDVETYGNAFNYGLSYLLDNPDVWLDISLLIILGSECIAGLILLVKGIKKSKDNKKMKVEKISNNVTNVLD
ncbi:MAG: hypothetical protein IKV81_03055 [Clostridia bacterium]|nr:hypothetical protein [Clostridia bacterium]